MSYDLVLIVDEDSEERSAILDSLRRAGYQAEAAAKVAQIEPYLRCPVRALVSKLGTNGNGRGMRILEAWRKRRPETPIVVIAPQDCVDDAVAAMRLGAIDCLPQPIDLARLTEAVGLGVARSKNGLAHAAEEGIGRPRGVDDSRSRPTNRPEFDRIMGHCPLMQDVFDQAELVAKTESTVLITGNTGTGKELLADAIHRLSGRRRKPFVAVNVAAVPTSLIESELFGHVKGAFTDAAAERIGRFEAASSGTLFIDEIGDLRLPSQAKLLRVLESHTINRVGSNRDVDVDVRVIAATSRNLPHMMSVGNFREDLFYRLNVVRIRLPDLRERKDDIPLLAEHFLKGISQKLSKSAFTLDPSLAAFFQDFEWPGNVRQLKNCLESMVVMAQDANLTLDDLPPHLRQPVDDHHMTSLPLAGHDLRHLERQAICQTLDQFDGNRTRAARLLGISVRTLQRKLKLWKDDGRRAVAM